MNTSAAEITSARRVHEMRIAVEIADPACFPVGALAGVLNAALGSWQVAPLLAEGSALWLVSGRVEEQVGTAEYAGRAHALVQAILRTGTVRRAEADLPVSAFADLGLNRRTTTSSSPGPFPPGSDDLGWARQVIRCAEAWTIEPTRGDGILIGHPDTGYTLHPNLGADALNLEKDRDLISNDNDAMDPLVPPEDSPWPLPFPGHGTTTASVIVGRGSEEAGIVGVAPGAKVVPLRAVESVVQIFDSDVARAVDHARLSGCHIVSISVGGKGFFGLETAIQKAVDAGMIVLAAAGNNVRFVIAPASYDNCLAVAATGPDDQPWPESSRGPRVDVSAPGWGVHVAGYTFPGGGAPGQAEVLQSSGTSYAATHLAGVAALWFAHHGPSEVRERYGPNVQSVFLQQLRAGGSRVPEVWDAAEFGAGIVDAAAMLSLPLPASSEVVRSIRRVAVESPLARLSALMGTDEEHLERGLSELFGRSGAELDRVVERFEGELAFHLLEHQDFRDRVLGGGAWAGFDVKSVAGSSPEFRAAVCGVVQDGVGQPET